MSTVIGAREAKECCPSCNQAGSLTRNCQAPAELLLLLFGGLLPLAKPLVGGGDCSRNWQIVGSSYYFSF